jgi:hypothetical protein
MLNMVYSHAIGCFKIKQVKVRQMSSFCGFVSFQLNQQGGLVEMRWLGQKEQVNKAFP